MNQPAHGGGQRFGAFTLHDVLARGGQGAVHKAVDALGRPCALKVLRDREPAAVERFRQEGRVLAKLSHPNLLRVTDMGEHEGTPFLAMEYVVGENLQERLNAGGIPPFAWTARVQGAVAHALHYCHQQGLVHRDLKPANVVIEAETERPVLVDFGMVKRDPEHMKLTSLDGARLSKTGEIKGTPRYMAPEQASPKKFGEVSPRTDVYALGATLYALLTGRPPFDGATVVEVLALLLRAPAPDPRAENPKVPSDLAAFCKRVLSKEPARRPESAEAFASELSRLTGQEAWLPCFPAKAPAPPPQGKPLGPKDPQSLGPYRLLGMLGAGGMGAVYVGVHHVLGVARAVKGRAAIAS